MRCDAVGWNWSAALLRGTNQSSRNEPGRSPALRVKESHAASLVADGDEAFMMVGPRFSQFIHQPALRDGVSRDA
jgi:hypothetical protein